MLKVAVIMSVYCNDKYNDFYEAINSMINQTYNADIYLFIDGDISSDIAELICSLEDESFFVIKGGVNVGLSKALNSLIDLIVTKDYDFVARMDSDDYSYLERLEKQIDYMKKHPSVDVLGTACREFGASYAIAKKKLPRNHEQLISFSITRCPFIHPTVMFKIKVFTDGNRYPENTVLTEDMALWFQLLNSGYQFSNLDDILLDYRLTEDTVLRRKGLKKAMNEINIRFKNMIYLKRISFKNISLILIRIIFHLMPTFLVKFSYKKLR